MDPHNGRLWFWYTPGHPPSVHFRISSLAHRESTGRVITSHSREATVCQHSWSPAVCRLRDPCPDSGSDTRHSINALAWVPRRCGLALPKELDEKGHRCISVITVLAREHKTIWAPRSKALTACSWKSVIRADDGYDRATAAGPATHELVGLIR